MGRRCYCISNIERSFCDLRRFVPSQPPESFICAKSSQQPTSWTSQAERFDSKCSSRRNLPTTISPLLNSLSNLSPPKILHLTTHPYTPRADRQLRILPAIRASGEDIMPTFTPFPRLPTELRAQIWAMTIHSRAVDVRVLCNRAQPARGKVWGRLTTNMVSSTPTPAILQTCREARYQGLYEQAFSEVPDADTIGRRYIWLNFAVDVVSIGRCSLEPFKTVASLIQRLKMERAISVERDAWQMLKLKEFVNVKEIYIVCLDGMKTWHKVSEEYFYPCGRENLFFINPDDSSIMRSIEIDLMFDEMLAEENRKLREENSSSGDEPV
ncbi:hypothetical protein F5B22DRAFT_611859 [Xylaria bambusicola]|uniref:uncharacterized protein n=1 Tax=Xylaria bambusicola TaxID=326684 RepID=UPI002007CA33|nr:uncharacterized protein F5B22DRAFT_611859 [Xylaria bambusicola]KAI0513260.1 hypothetical protein F5B22DRAFT_611859 [Xylaria bambusicola]